MSRMSISTPCPQPFALSNLPIPAGGRRVSFAATNDDDTANIDYTRELPSGLQHVKPRRKSTFQRKEARAAPITIFEDVVEGQELVVEPRRELGGTSLLAKPAQKANYRALYEDRGQVTQESRQPAQSITQGRRASVLSMDTQQARSAQSTFGDRETDKQSEGKPRGGLRKEPRRKTIYVPDDTTLLTIHPGAQTTERLNDTFQLPNYRNAAAVGAPAVAQAFKRPRLSMTAPAKRVPLQSVAAYNKQNIFAGDIEGMNGGKENLPPRGGSSYAMAEPKVDDTKLKTSKPITARSSLFQQTAASQARRSIVPREAAPMPKIARPSIARGLLPEPNAAPNHNPEQHSRRSILPWTAQQSQHEPLAQQQPTTNNGRRQESAHRKVPRLPQYPVLLEDLDQPELYEDHWLSHQEIALTEVVNRLFQDAEPAEKQAWNQPKSGLRQQLLQIYHKQEVTTLHRRLQASLLYGALSRPRDSQTAPDPERDIGLRKRFLGLWLDSYDQRMLRAAAEVVFGHQLPPRSSSDGSNEEGTLDPHRGRRTLVGFLETFLVDVEDVEEAAVDRGDGQHPKWRKMILRSLMLVWLLDRGIAKLGTCLFKSTSLRKTSVAVLHSLSTMLIPTVGDVTKTLRHLEYELSYMQDPLNEVQYRIENIAVDLRDGILLTRLVELLLFSSNKARSTTNRHDPTVTIHMPDLTILESALYDAGGGSCPRVLSQHLKMPCLARAQKVYNVDIALSALRDHGCLRASTEEISAEDIVNGHRERTLGLLWTLVSNHGLEQLLDYGELLADIRRKSGDAVDIPNDALCLTQPQQERLIKRWAFAYCADKGLRVGNLTTSFADGRAYAAILDGFSGGANDLNASPSECKHRLNTQLRTFGCSSAFINQIISNAGTIPSRKTTISNLAFLASRLLPLARRQNAARVIQRAFRRRRERVLVSQRIALVRLAYACAAVVETQQRVTAAAVTLQTAWRAVLQRRVDRMNANAEVFQAVAKGFLVRRGVNRESFRVMGGW